MLRIPEIVDAYEIAMASDERLQASRFLELLECDRFLNEDDWQLTYKFCSGKGLDGRLEIITRKFVKSGLATSLKPYLVLSSLLIKSGRLPEARSIVNAYIEISGNLMSDRRIIDLLFEVQEYNRALAVVENCLRKEPDNVVSLILEVRAFWKLNLHRKARRKLRHLVKLHGGSNEHIVWLLGVALECKELISIRLLSARLVYELNKRTVKVSRNVVSFLNASGLEHIVRDVIANASLSSYTEIVELEDVFELALRYGVYNTAREFGAAILGRDKKHILRDKIDKVLAGPQFLMS
jgi:tetratricopeptide (TPR) repeat protein